jgi:hypothetical protein
MDLIDILFRLPEAIYWLASATRFWRFGLALLSAGLAVIVLCHFVPSPTIRWIAGFHITAVFVLLGTLWETRGS